MPDCPRKQVLFEFPEGVRSMGIHISRASKEWLLETDSDNCGGEVSHLDIFNSLLASMQTSARNGRGFYRPASLRPGQAQVSFNRMEKAWNMGRKRLRRILSDMEALGLAIVDSDRTATVVTLTCVCDWVTDDGFRYENAFYRFRRAQQ